jgi:hypothetical protein
MAMITHMHDILEAMIESIFGKLGAMPFLLRYFFKVLYTECMTKYKQEYGELKILTLMSEFLISKWLANVCFFKSGLHGLSKDFYLESNCKDNLRLLGEVTLDSFN